MSRLYKASNILTLNANVPVDFIGVTGDNIVHFNPIAVEAESSPIIVELYESTTFSNGTLVNPVAVNRNNHRPSETLSYANPTILNLGTKLVSHIITGTKQTGGVLLNSDTFVLKKNTAYLYRITYTGNNSSVCCVNLVWSEDNGNG